MTKLIALVACMLLTATCAGPDTTPEELHKQLGIPNCEELSSDAEQAETQDRQEKPLRPPPGSLGGPALWAYGRVDCSCWWPGLQYEASLVESMESKPESVGLPVRSEFYAGLHMAFSPRSYHIHVRCSECGDEFTSRAVRTLGRTCGVDLGEIPPRRP